LISKLPIGAVLDGEIYCQGMACQEIASVVATKSEPHPNESKLKYVVFDVITGKNDWYDVRYTMLQSAFRELASSLKTLQLIQNERAETMDQIQKWHEQFSERYEGTMIRLPMFPYEHKRSSSLLKLKTFQDAEFKIVDVTEGVGQDKGCATMMVQTSKGQPFSARMTGTLEQRQAYFTNRKQCIGKMLTVKFQELTMDGIPRFPVGVCIRDYE